MTAREHIEVDTCFGLESDTSARAELNYSTESLASSIYEYRFENGRRYHAFRDGSYPFPNDETEQDRLDIYHHVNILFLEGKLHMAPIGDSPEKILDIGCGTGIWAIDCGELYPSAQVIGIDLSPIQPSWVPANVQFQIDDAELEWAWDEDTFDFVHMRHLGGAIKDWDYLLEQAYRAIKPGGWIEICEWELHFYSDDDTVTEDSSMKTWSRLMLEASEISGRHFISKTVPILLEAAGFNPPLSKIFKQPIGLWPADQKQKEVGAYTQLLAETGFEALGLALLTRSLEMEVDAVEILIQGCKKEFKDPGVHSYLNEHFYYTQKPLHEE